MTSNILLLSVITLALLSAFWMAPREGASAPGLLNCLCVVLLAAFVNLIVPVWLAFTLRGGMLTWAAPYSDPATVRTALLYVGIGLGSFILAYAAFRSSSPRSQIQGGASWDRVERSRTLLWAIVWAGLGLKLFALAQVGIGPDLFTRLSRTARTTGQLRGAEGNLRTYIIIASTAADAASGALLALQLRAKKHVPQYAMLTAALSGLTYLLSPKRSALLLVIVFCGCAVNRLRHRLTLKDLPGALLAITGFGMLTLLFRILAPNRAAGTVVDLRQIQYSHGSILQFYLFSPEFASFDMVARSVVQSGTILDALGGRAEALYRANIEPFLYIIPRALWPGKPDYFVDLSHGFYVATFGGGLSESTSGIAATMIGYGAVLGGPIAILVSMGVLGAIAAALDSATANDGYVATVWKAFTLVIAFQMFRQGSIGWVFLGVVQNMAPAMLVWLAAGRGLHITKSTS